MSNPRSIIMKRKLSLFILALISCTSVFATTYYVSLTGSDTPPYNSWGTAATRIQDAVDAARAGDTVSVYDGVYDLGYTTTPGYASKNRLVITKNITVRSFGGPSVTTISGRQQSGFPINKTLVRCVYMTTGTLRGFTLEKGYANLSTGSSIHDQSGGGVNLYEGGLVENCIISDCIAINNGGGSYEGTLVDCTFTDNIATNDGGGSFSGNLTDCTLSGNKAAHGGGLHSGYANNCLVSSNSANNGGGSCQAILTDCTLSGNTANYGGGDYQSTLIDCMLSGNTAKYGGGIRYGVLTGCTLSNNTATLSGGGSSSCASTNCTYTANVATNGGGGSYQGTLTDCTLSNNSAQDGGGSYLGTLTDCKLTGNTATHDGGGTRSSTLIRCIISENTAVNQGGGADGGTLTECTLMNNDGGTRGGGGCNATLDRCLISDNTASYGGGIYGFSTGSSATNCIVTGNTATWGGGAYGDVVIHNCTIKGNSAVNHGGGCNKGRIYNSIIVGNLADTNEDGNGFGDDLSQMDSVIACCTPVLEPGEIGITNAPNFADLQLHLRPDSPCIDRGNQQGPIGLDFDGTYRPLDATASGTAYIDMGAYEFAGSGDLDNDGLTDAEEVALGSDLNNNDTDDDGRTDGDEVAMGFSPTYNEGAAIAQGEDNVTDDPAAHGLYTADSIQDLNMGVLMVQAEGDLLHLSLQMKQTTNLTSNVWNDAGEAQEWTINATNGKSFFRVFAE